MTRNLFIALVLALGFGCATDANGPALEPALEGKADVSDQVTDKGRLIFEDNSPLEASAEFRTDLEFHGFTFQSAADSVVDIEITQRGSARGLDTTLFVYHRNDRGAYERIAFDDESGWGQLSEIEGLEIPETDNYLIVVGTHFGDGRGTYRLELRCASGNCVDLDAPVPTACPEDVAYLVDECVAESRAESDYSINRHDAFEGCMSDWAPEWYSFLCRNPLEFCPLGEDVYVDEIVPACTSELAELYPAPLPSVSLSRRDVDTELEDRVAAAGDEYAYARVGAYQVNADDAEVTLERVMDTLAGGESVPWEHGGRVSDSRFMSFATSYDLGDDVLDLVRAMAGSDTYELGVLSANYYVAAGAEAWADKFVFFFDNGFVVEFDFESGES